MTATANNARHAIVALFGAVVCTMMLVSASAPAITLVA